MLVYVTDIISVCFSALCRVVLVMLMFLVASCLFIQCLHFVCSNFLDNACFMVCGVTMLTALVPFDFFIKLTVILEFRITLG